MNFLWTFLSMGQRDILGDQKKKWRWNPQACDQSPIPFNGFFRCNFDSMTVAAILTFSYKLPHRYSWWPMRIYSMCVFLYHLCLCSPSSISCWGPPNRQSITKCWMRMLLEMNDKTQLFFYFVLFAISFLLDFLKKGTNFNCPFEEDLRN